MHSQDLFTALFNTNPGQRDNSELLEAITKKYPYFSAAQFFLLKNTQPTDENYNKVAAKASLHFNNPFLLNYRMKEEDIKIGVEKKTEAVVEPVKMEPVQEDKKETIEKADLVENAGMQEAGKTAKVEPAEEMIFEPLFATDYFASQGIKLSEEVQSSDKLGRQLKSFTEWLKTMKKVHENKLPAGNEQLDLAVQKLAEKSNEEDDILTESMAEAYLQQGKAKKAREIFEKLSLFNPSKSAYFAAKIESIALDK